MKDVSICIYVDPEGDMFGEEDDSTAPAPGRGFDPDEFGRTMSI